MKGMPDSVVLGTIGHAKRRAVKNRIAGRKAAARYRDLTFRDYVGGTILLLLTLTLGAIIL